jgi:hypothetical protein
LRSEGNVARLEAGHAHVDFHLLVTHRHCNARIGGLKGQRRLGAELLIVHEARETAHAVSTLFCARSVGVEYSTSEIRIGIGWRLEDEKLIEADTAMPVRPPTNELWLEVDVLSHEVDDHEIVAEAVHFAESKLHDGETNRLVYECKTTSGWR